jgi:hypothetical protein
MSTALQNHAHLLVRMHERVWLESDQAEHHLAAGGSLNLNAGKNLMPK